NGDVFVERFPSERVSIELNFDLGELLVGGVFQTPEASGGKSDDAPVGQLDVNQSAARPCANGSRFRLSGGIKECGIHDISGSGKTGARRSAARWCADRGGRSHGYWRAGSARAKT